MRKKAARVAIFLLLGAMVNISVAWWFAYRLPPHNGEFHPLNWDKFVGYTMSESQFPRWCFYWHELTATKVYNWYVEFEDGQVRYAPLAESLKQVPHWTTVGHTEPHLFDKDAITPQRSGFVEEARGWPLLSFSCRIEMKYDQQANYTYPVSVSGGIAIKREEWRAPPSFRGLIIANGTLPEVGPLPYRPIWPGLFVNTVFYAIPLYIILHTPFWLRRSIRKRHNRCPDCGYPIGTSPKCTECGYQLVKSNT